MSLGTPDVPFSSEQPQIDAPLGDPWGVVSIGTPGAPFPEQSVVDAQLGTFVGYVCRNACAPFSGQPQGDTSKASGRTGIM